MLAVRLKELRKINNYSQTDMANKLGISPAAYGYYEQGKTYPAVSVLQDISDIFNVSIDYLLGRSDVMNPNAEEDESVKILAREAKNLTPSQINLVRSIIEEIKKEQ